jgi:hypothetical protein
MMCIKITKFPVGPKPSIPERGYGWFPTRFTIMLDHKLITDVDGKVVCVSIVYLADQQALES